MNDQEFLSYLRARKRRSGSKVEHPEASSLLGRCTLLTLDNVWRMLEAPIQQGDWWLGDEVRAYIDGAHAAEFVALTRGLWRSHRDEKIETQIETRPAGPVRAYDIRESKYVARKEHGVLSVKFEVLRRGTDVREPYKHHALTVILNREEKLTRDEWNEKPPSEFLYSPMNAGMWQRDQAIDAEPEDGEARVALAFTLAPLPNSGGRLATLWGLLEARTPEEQERVRARVRALSKFAYEVPFVVDDAKWDVCV